MGAAFDFAAHGFAGHAFMGGSRQHGVFGGEPAFTGVFFEAWFQQCLLPALTQKSVIILDNARFHRLGVLREMAEKWGHKVLPLAPYSPELNPIEKVWANIKRYLRTVLSDYARFDDALLSYFDFN